MKALAGLQVLSNDGERVLCRGWRSEGNPSARHAVIPVAGHPAPASLERLAHEYGLREELDSDWAVRPLDLVRERDGTVLVLKEWEWIVSQVRSLLWLFVSCFLSTFASAGSERLTVAYPQWPPYKVVQNGTIGGIDALVLNEIARRTGLEFDYVECPWPRCLTMLQNGSVDMITSIAQTEERKESMYFLEPPTRDNYAISFYTNVKAKHAISRYEDLYELDIGVIRSSAYFERFDQDHKLQKTFVTQETQLVDMLARQRLDVIVGIGANLDYLIHQTGRSGVIKKSSFEVEAKDPAYIAVSKKSKHKGVIPQIEKALSDMRRANEIEKIERSFLEALARTNHDPTRPDLPEAAGRR